MKNISVEELHNKIKNNENIAVIDVRDKVDYKSGHIKGSKNWKIDELLNNKEELKDYDMIYLYCNTGNQSGQVYEQLVKEGFNNIANVHEGIQGWLRENYRVERTGSTISINRQVQIMAGSLILIGSLLSIFVNIYFLIIPIFVGCGLTYAGISGVCPSGLLLAKMPWNKV